MGAGTQEARGAVPPRRVAAVIAFALGAAAIAALPAGAATLHAKLADARTHAPVTQAQVRVSALADSTQGRTAFSLDDGTVEVESLVPGVYRFEAFRLGYLPLRREVTIAARPLDLGTLAMTSSALPVPALEVRGKAPAALQHADTTDFDARAFHTHADATAGELVEKLPGVTVQNGTVKHNGEQVQQVLVDGKPYFGQDPGIALSSLPADVVERIQVFDKLSDQSQFTGFDDGNSVKTMNVVLRPDRRRGQFGKAYAGPGSDERYLGGGSLNVLRKDLRVSAIGLANNVNQQNFAQQDLLGVLSSQGQRGGGHGPGGFGGGRGPGGGAGGPGNNFIIGTQDGITTTTSGGANVMKNWGQKVTWTQSWFYNLGDNANVQSIARSYVVPQDSVVRYDQLVSGGNRNANHRFDGRLEATLGPATSLIEEPQLYFQSNRATSAMTGVNVDPLGLPRASALTNSGTNTTGSNLSNHLVLRHRFPKDRRTVSLDLRAGYTDKDGASAYQSLDERVLAGVPTADTLDRRTTLSTITRSAGARLAWTEPLGAGGMLEMNVSPRVTRSVSDNRAYVPDLPGGPYVVPDPTQSNSFESTSREASAGLGYLLRKGALNLSANLNAQSSRLQSERTLPSTTRVDRTFTNVLPSMTLGWRPSAERNLRASLFTSTRAPSISQLQDLVDTSNPLQYSTGNPGLRDATVSHGSVRWAQTNAATGRSVFVMASLQRTDDYVANATVTAAHDSVLPGGAVLRAGSQLVRPVNLPVQWTANSFVTVSRTVKPIKSVLNLSGGGSWSRTPGRIEGADNRADAWSPTTGVVLTSNVSENLDFTLNWTGTWSLTHNSLAGASDTRSYTQSAGCKLNVVLWRDLAVRNELAQTQRTGLAGGYGGNLLLWNASLAWKFLRDRSGEVRFTASDVLDQNRAVARTVTDAYVQDTSNRVLRPYAMLLVTWTLKPPPGMEPPARRPDDHRGGPGFPGGHPDH